MESAAARATSTSSTSRALARTHWPAARLTAEISESARNLLAARSSRSTSAVRICSARRTLARSADPSQRHRQRRPPAPLDDLDGAHEVFDFAFGALALGAAATGAGATTVRDGFGVDADLAG